MALNDATLWSEIFPRLAQQLRETGEVCVDYELASHFAYYIMLQQFDLWMRLEQQLQPTDDLKARFYLRGR